MTVHAMPTETDERPRNLTPSPQWLSIPQLDDLPPSRPLLGPYVAEQDLVMLYGESAVGKTHIGLSAALGLAGGADHWCGHALQPGVVAYCCLEGIGGIRRRIKAYLQEKAENPGVVRRNFFVTRGPVDLLDAQGFVLLRDSLSDLPAMPHLVVIDTWGRAFAGDENSAKDTGAAIRNLDAIRALTNGAVMVIHHRGKDASRGARGSSALLAAVDSALEVERTPDGIILLTAKKTRDGDSPPTQAFRLHSVDIGEERPGVVPVNVEIGESVRKPASRQLIVNFLVNLGEDEWTSVPSIQRGSEGGDLHSRQAFYQAVKRLEREECIDRKPGDSSMLRLSSKGRVALSRDEGDVN